MLGGSNSIAEAELDPAVLELKVIASEFEIDAEESLIPGLEEDLFFACEQNHNYS